MGWRMWMRLLGAVEAAGGIVVEAPSERPGGRGAVRADPSGARFAVIAHG
jgi:predicted enzyme related to lactoylglutathione lyase